MSKKALNPAVAQIPPLSMDLYFEISMPGFVALHILEYTLPPELVRKTIQDTKVVVGIPFCVISDCLARVNSKGLKMSNLPDIPLDMQGTMGVTSDLKLQDVVSDMKKWGEENSENLEALVEQISKPKQKQL